MFPFDDYKWDTCPGCGNPFNRCTCEPDTLEDYDEE